jgi:hypothetical protein
MSYGFFSLDKTYNCILMMIDTNSIVGAGDIVGTMGDGEGAGENVALSSHSK